MKRVAGGLIHKGKTLFQVLLMPCLILLVAWILLFATGNVEERQNAESLKQVEDAVQKAVLSCYSIEGSYPATVEYIEEHYGLQIDHEKYHVFYEIFADNLMPEITVVEK